MGFGAGAILAADYILCIAMVKDVLGEKNLTCHAVRIMSSEDQARLAHIFGGNDVKG